MRKNPKSEFPLIVTRGYATVKIYRVENRGKPLYTLSYASPQGRVRQNLTDLSAAKREAVSIAEKLTRNEAHALSLTGEDRQVYVSARDAIAPTGVPLDVAAREFAAAYEIIGRDAMVEAARYFKKHADTALPQVSAEEAVSKFIEAKKAEGVSPLYLKDIRLMLGDFKDAFHTNIASVTTDDLRAYLNHKKIGPVAMNNRRRLLVAIYNFSKAQGWLPKSESTAADGLGSYKVKDKDVEVFSPEEVARLIGHAGVDFLPWVVLIAFGGIRHEELKKGLAWEHINFLKGTLLVPANIAKTGRKRKIEMPANLRAWLAPYSGRIGPIFNKDPRKPMARMAKAADVTWRVNALRHSFGSYRMDQVKNAGQVALEMGNSASIVMKHYFEIVDADAAKAYWAITPPTDQNVVSFAG